MNLFEVFKRLKNWLGSVRRRRTVRVTLQRFGGPDRDGNFWQTGTQDIELTVEQVKRIREQIDQGRLGLSQSYGPRPLDWMIESTDDEPHTVTDQEFRDEYYGRFNPPDKYFGEDEVHTQRKP